MICFKKNHLLTLTCFQIKGQVSFLSFKKERNCRQAGQINSGYTTGLTGSNIMKHLRIGQLKFTSYIMEVAIQNRTKTTSTTEIFIFSSTGQDFTFCYTHVKPHKNSILPNKQKLYLIRTIFFPVSRNCTSDGISTVELIWYLSNVNTNNSSRNCRKRYMSGIR